VLYDENYAISLEKQSTCGKKYRDILRNIAIDFFDDSIRYIDIEFDISSHHYYSGTIVPFDVGF